MREYKYKVTWKNWLGEEHVKYYVNVESAINKHSVYSGGIKMGVVSAYRTTTKYCNIIGQPLYIKFYSPRRAERILKWKKQRKWQEIAL